MRSFFYVVICLFIVICCKTLKTKEVSVGLKKGNHVLSSRFFHPHGNNDVQSTVKAIETLKPKRIDWTYCDDEEVLNVYKKYGLPFSLAINPQQPDSLGYTTKKFRLKDYQGISYSAPWMKNWKQKNPYWGCVNNPGFYKIFVERGLKLAALGAYAIFVDDAVFNKRLSMEKKVGCFCRLCVEKFGELNRSKTNVRNRANSVIGDLKKSLVSGEFEKKINVDWNKVHIYEDFQIKSVIRFLKKWQAEIRESYPNIVFLTNNYNGDWSEIYRVFDGGIAELKEKHINDNDLDSLYAMADKLGKTQLFTIATENPVNHFKLMAYNIKHNRESMYPWDIMIPDKNRRYYLNLDSIVHKEKELLKKYKD